jgi:hypothetical protein
VTVGDMRESPADERPPDATGSSAFANPKSRIFTLPSGVNFTFAGFNRGERSPGRVPLEPFGDLPRDVDRLRDGDGSPFQPLRQVFAGHQLERDEAHALSFVESVDAGDRRVVQRREHLRFALEPRQPLGIGGQGRREELDRDVPPERRVVRLPEPLPCRPRRFSRRGDS